ncbi:MAG: asparagine synthase-related protein [Actinomycetota bacterium]|nr:asparagine synthase-related protein [Actinomycetota bacterium]
MIVDAMRRSLRHRAPDGIDVRTRDNVAVIFGRLHATPEACFERQPHECSDGTWLVADARIDNRAELMERFGWARPAATTTDVELLATCYAQAGPRASMHLLGDFAVVIIDTRGRICCWRDHLGVKPLYYWIGDDWVVIGSELRQIMAHPDAPWAANIGLLGEYLSGWVESTTATVIQGVHRVPAAHGLVISREGARSWRYWMPPFEDRIELDTLADYEEQFRSLFTEAVQCRLRAVGPVGVELSGGLDSTSVTAMAARLVSFGRVSVTDVLAHSCVFPWSGRADENHYIREAVNHLGLDWTAIVDDGERPAWAWDDALFWSDIPLPPDGPAHVDLCRSARDRGCSVVLTGHGGDHWFDPSPYALPELIEDHRFATAWRMARGFTGAGLRASTSLLLKAAVALNRPSWMHRPGAPKRAAAVTGGARVEARLDARRSPGRLPRAFRRLRAQRHFEHCAGGYDAMSFEIFDRTAALAGVEYRHPYFDRRLVEFGCRVPVTVHATPTLNRRLQREALRDLLPAGVAARRTKARFSEVWLREVDRHLPNASWPDTHVVRNGWVDLREARAGMARTRAEIAGPRGAGQIFFLWGMVQVESVLRALSELPDRSNPDHGMAADEHPDAQAQRRS